MTTLNDPALQALAERVQQLEQFTIATTTSQPQPLPELATDASTNDVRAAVIEILAVLRNLRIGA